MLTITSPCSHNKTKYENNLKFYSFKEILVVFLWVEGEGGIVACFEGNFLFQNVLSLMVKTGLKSLKQTLS